MDKKNLLVRVLSSLVLIPATLGVIYKGDTYFLGFIILVALLSTKEMIALIGNKSSRPFTVLLYVLAGAICWMFYTNNFEYIVMSVIAALLFQKVYELFRHKDSVIVNNSGFMLTLVYTGFFLGSSVWVRENYNSVFNVEYTQGGYFLFMIFASIWACDSFAYFGGSTFGKHKLYPKVSPNKSIEGAVSGLVGALATAFVFQATLLPELSFVLTLVLGLITGIFGQIGDLIESMYKRDAKVKDSGNTIPGHGGVLDRLDSFIFVSPIVFIVLKVLSV